jgi:hypothetical protein
LNKQVFKKLNEVEHEEESLLVKFDHSHALICKPELDIVAMNEKNKIT